MGTLDGKRALVTGASSGIGRAIAHRLAQEGARVAVHGRDEARSHETLEQVRQRGGDGAVILADLGDADAAARVVREAIERFGGLDVLVNNAGTQTRKAFLELTEGDWEKVMNVDLRSAFFATQTFVRHLRQEERSGAVVNVSSVHEELPFPCYAPYAVAKAGLAMMTRTLAVELAGTGIRINAVSPGAVWAGENVEMSANQRREIEAKIPLRRVARPEEIAAAVAFLAGPDASYVHGTSLFVDGGLTWAYEE